MSCAPEEWSDSIKKIIHKATRIKSANLIRMFTDDHCPCVEMELTFASGKRTIGKINCGFWWRSERGVVVCAQSEISSKARTTLLRELKTQLDHYNSC